MLIMLTDSPITSTDFSKVYLSVNKTNISIAQSNMAVNDWPIVTNI